MKRNRKARPVFEVLEPRRMMSATLTPGTITEGNIAAAGQSDSYTFSVPQGADIEIDTNGVKQDSQFLAKFVLTAPNGGLADQWWTNSADSEPLQNLAAGTYTLTVADYYRSNRGQYSIGLEGISPANPNPTELSFGGIVQGKITQSLETREYSFTLGSPGTVQLATKGSPLDSGFLASFALFSADGAKVHSWWTNSATSPEALNLPAGKYMLKANDYYLNGRGSYSIGLDLLNAPFSGGIQPLTPGGITSGEIKQALESKQFSFNLATPTLVQFKTDGSPIEPSFLARFDLHNSDGTSVASWWTNSATDQTPLSLPAGSYMLKASDYYLNSRGEFSIGLELLSSTFSPDAKVLPGGVNVSGTVSAPLDSEQLTFTATDTVATFTTSGSAIDDGFLAKFSVYDSNGTLKDSWWTNSTDTVDVSELTVGRGYVLEVSDYHNAARGNFTVIGSGMATAAVNPSTTTLAEADPSIIAGSQATFTATVGGATAGGASPTGIVDFISGGIVIGSSAVQANGTAVFATTNLPIGASTITGHYHGDASYAESTSAPVIETVNTPGPGVLATKTTLAEAAASVAVGGEATFTATVSPSGAGAVSPAGTVDFLSNGVVIGSAALQSDGTAVFSTTTLAIGDETLTAHFRGETGFAESTSNSVIETVHSIPSAVVPVLDKVVLPASVKAGTKMKGKVSVLITNRGATLKGQYSIALCLNTSTTLDGNQVVLQTFRKAFTMKRGASKLVSFTLKSLPTRLAGGSYYVLASSTDPDGLLGSTASQQSIRIV